LILHDGTKVQVDGLRMSRVYAGMMEGIPTKEQNDSIIEKAKTSFHKLWGERKAHVVDPVTTVPKIMGLLAGHGEIPDNIKKMYPDPQALPDYMYQVWLSSFVTIDFEDISNGTEVVLIFFADKEAMQQQTLPQLIHDASKSFLWKDVCEGWEF